MTKTIISQKRKLPSRIRLQLAIARKTREREDEIAIKQIMAGNYGTQY